MKKTKTILKHIYALTLVTSMFFAIASTTYASENVKSNPVTTGSITFSDLLANPNQIYSGVDTNGNAFTVGIEPVNQHFRNNTNSWKVYFIGGVANAEFYMDVTNNKCTRAYDDNISIIGGTFSSESLSRTSTYAKLTFNYTIINNIAMAKAWLKGTVTGSGNEVNVTWKI